MIPSKQFNFAGARKASREINFTRSTSGVALDALLRPISVAASMPRLEYSPETSECLGLEIEESATNLQTNSQLLNSASYIRTNITVTDNAVAAPDKTTTASRVTETSATGNHVLASSIASSVTAGDYIQISVFAKPDTRTKFVFAINNTLFGGSVMQVAFDLAAISYTVLFGSVMSAKITALPNGWFECRFVSMVTTASLSVGLFTFFLVSSGTTTSYTGDGTSGLWLWGAEAKKALMPTSYIPAIAAAVTRSADIAIISGTNFSNFWRTDEGSLILVGDCVYSDTTSRYFFAISDGTVNNYIAIRVNTGVLYYTGVVGGVTQWDINLGSYTNGSQVTIAISWKLNDIDVSINGGAVLTDTSATIPTVSQIELGSFLSAGWLNGHIARLTYYAKALPSSLQGLSS